MCLRETKLKGVYKYRLRKFRDSRGVVTEIYNKKNFTDFKLNFIQDNFSVSKKNVLRGMHGDNTTWKLVTAIKGEVYIIVANNNRNSDHYKKWISFKISEKNYFQILIPPKYALGYLALSDEIVINYKQTTYYGDYKQFTIKYNDPDFNFKWPKKKLILSKRDK